MSYGIYHNQTKKVVNGKVQIVDTFSFPSSMIEAERQIWLINRGWSERSAYMIACNVSEADMQRVENN